jgi:hypothetical protein
VTAGSQPDLVHLTAAHSLDISAALEEDVIDKPILVWLPVTVVEEAEASTCNPPDEHPPWSVPEIVTVQVYGGVGMNSTPHAVEAVQSTSSLQQRKTYLLSGDAVEAVGATLASHLDLPLNRCIDDSSGLSRDCHLEVGLQHLGFGGCWTTILTTLNLKVRPAFAVHVKV